jgi:hypothetical protein
MGCEFESKIIDRKETYELAKKEMVHDDIRWGQAVFNVISAYLPKEAIRLVGTNKDCFYEDSKVEEFLDEIFGTSLI